MAPLSNGEGVVHQKLTKSLDDVLLAPESLCQQSPRVFIATELAYSDPLRAGHQSCDNDRGLRATWITALRCHRNRRTSPACVMLACVMRWAFALGLVAACGPSAQPGAPVSLDAGPHMGSDASVSAATRCNDDLAANRGDYTPPIACRSNPTEVIGFATTNEQFMSLIVGEWLLCDSPSAFGTTDEIGIEIAADMTWYKLYPDGHGGIVRGTGDDQHGLYDTVALGDHVQLDLNEVSGGTLVTAPQFAGDPSEVRLNNEGIGIADYIKNDSSGRCNPSLPHPPLGMYSPPAACAEMSPPVSAPSAVADASALLVGKWLSCDGASVFCSSNDIGLEFDADGTFYKLYVLADGTITRLQGWQRYGAYSLMDFGFIQLEMDVYGSGMVYSTLQFGDNPRTLALDNEGVCHGSYVSQTEASALTAQ